MQLLLSLLLLAAFIAAARAITCYECESVNDKYCGETFLPEDIAQTDCDALEVPERLRIYYPQRPATACLTKYYEGLPGETYFIRRSCYFGDLADSYFSCDEHPDPLVPYLNFMGCFVCDDDLCNAANSPQKLSLSLGLATGLILLLIMNPFLSS